MCVASQAEEVDFGTLAYHHKKLGARVVIVVATRGENSWSKTGSQIEEAVGVHRTRELLRTARIAGADLYLLNLPDPGQVRSVDEVISGWGRDEALKRLVHSIRLIRPDVVIANSYHNTAAGQHQAVARLALEAFEASADSARFPEEVSRVWQVQRVFQRVTEDQANVTVNLNEYDPARGSTYAQTVGVAAGTENNPFRPRRVSDTGRRHYKLMRSTTGERIGPGVATLLEGLKLNSNIGKSIAPPHVGGTPLLQAMMQRDALVDALVEKLIEKRAEGSVNDLVGRYGPDFFRVIRYSQTLERAIALALGIEFTIKLSDTNLIPGQQLTVQLSLTNGSNRPLPVIFRAPDSLPQSVESSSTKDSELAMTAPRSASSHTLEYQIPTEVELTVPHSTHLHDTNYYPAGSALPGSLPEEPFGNEITAIADVALGQTSVAIGAMARYDITSPVEIMISPPFGFVRSWSVQRQASFTVRVRNRVPGELSGALWVVPLALMNDDYQPVRIDFRGEDDEASVKLDLRLPILKPPLATDVLLEFRRESETSPIALGSAKITVEPVNFIGPGKLTVGYVAGTDSSLKHGLAQLGVESVELEPSELDTKEHGSRNRQPSACTDLGRFDTIILDTLAYTINSDLSDRNHCLLEYVRKGGRLLVLSQDSDTWNFEAGRITLAPFRLSLERQLAVPAGSRFKVSNPIPSWLTNPNRLTDQDFGSWAIHSVTDLPAEWDSEYQVLLELAQSASGSKPTILAARLGKGSYVFAALDLRQSLLEGNQGTYRLLSNLISRPFSDRSLYEEW
jgi:LmbE family N-acetylglucosaminyl deacetylase